MTRTLTLQIPNGIISYEEFIETQRQEIKKLQAENQALLAKNGELEADNQHLRISKKFWEDQADTEHKDRVRLNNFIKMLQDRIKQLEAFGEWEEKFYASEYLEGC